MNNKNRVIVPLVLGLAAVLFFATAVVSAVVLKTSDKIVDLDNECNYSHNSSLISSIAAMLGNRAAEFNNGVCLMEKKEYGEAYDVFMSAAEKGLAEAQCALGQMYAEGLGVAQDYVQAEHWYRMAANQGDIDAMVYLGTMYYSGVEDYGIHKDFNKAFHYYSRAANFGNDAEAQLYLAYMYLRGEGTEQDLEKAFEWTEKSAKQGFAQAQNELGRAYEQMKQDYNKAIEWYQKAAAQNYQPAQQNLKRINENGGVPQAASKKSTVDDLDLEHLFTEENTAGLRRGEPPADSVYDPFADLDLGNN